MVRFRPHHCGKIAASMADTPLSNALKRRKELQDSIKAQLKELDKLDEWIRMYRQLAASADSVRDEGQEAADPSARALGAVGTGATQAVFEQRARAILHEMGRPMQSAEFVDEFQKRGHPLGGSNETKTAWNRLWSATKRNQLTHLPKLGYWIPGEPLSPEATKRAKEAIARRNSQTRKAGYQGRGRRHSATGAPRGRPRSISQAQLRVVAEAILAEDKSVEQLATDFGISVWMVRYYFGSTPEAREQTARELLSATAQSDSHQR